MLEPRRRGTLLGVVVWSHGGRGRCGTGFTLAGGSVSPGLLLRIRWIEKRDPHPLAHILDVPKHGDSGGHVSIIRVGHPLLGFKKAVL